MRPNSLPRHPLNTWTFLFIVHIPTQHSHMHTRRLKTFRPQPQEPGGGGGGGAGPTGAGRGRGRLLLPSLPGARRLHINKRAGEAALDSALGKGEGT